MSFNILSETQVRPNKNKIETKTFQSTFDNTHNLELI